MNKDLLAQQVDALRWAEKPEDIIYKSANVVQFCLQQLLVDDVDVFLNYIASQSEIQHMFKNIQEMVEIFLKIHINECNDSLKQKISEKIEKSRIRTPIYLEKLNEKDRKSKELILKEKKLKEIENEIKILEEEQQSIDKKIQDLKMIQIKLSEYNIKQIEKDLKELKVRVEQEKELYSKEERREKQLGKELQVAIDSMQILEIEIDNKSKDIIQTTMSILSEKKESSSKKRERLQKLKQKEQEYIECYTNSIKMYSDAKAYLSENERIADQMKPEDIFSDNQKQQRNEIKKDFWQKMSEMEQLNHVLNDNINWTSYEKASTEEKV